MYRLYLMNDELEQCQYTCMTLLRNDKDNEEATVMMADLAFRYYKGILKSIPPLHNLSLTLNSYTCSFYGH